MSARVFKLRHLSDMSKRKKFLILIAFIACFLIFAFSFFPEKENEDKEILITVREYVLRSFLNELPEINKKLPYKVDSQTTFNILKFEENKIVSIYEIASNAISFDRLEKIKPLIKKKACIDEMKKKLLDVDIDFLDRYQNPTGDILFEVRINNSECAQL
jgi:hypothetical protein